MYSLEVMYFKKLWFEKYRKKILKTHNSKLKAKCNFKMTNCLKPQLVQFENLISHLHNDEQGFSKDFFF